MSLRSVLRVSARISIGLVLAAAALPLSYSDAEARGGFKGKVVNAGAAGARHHDASEETSSEAPDTASQDATTDAAAETPAVPAAAPLRAQAITKAPVQKIAPKDADVPGCTTGMICIVCLAGCNGDVNMIVHSVPKRH
jgi:hypothetical protein